MPNLKLVEDEIARKLKEAAETGELQGAEGYGRPMIEDIGWESTPAEFRMPFKILKNAGVVPPEIELFHQRAKLRAELDAATTNEARATARRALSELEQRLALRLEGLRANGKL
ncbi:MAG: DnaJ family domain-containing protein [Burkholderiales bacterium]|nr:DnaJ family domain-containing protein [Burkholderiales bacterium]